MDYGVGDLVYVVYWRKFPIPGNDANGSWEFAPTRVISRGKKSTCVETHNQSVLGEDSPTGSSIRFVDPADVFPDRARAVEETQKRRPPAAG